MDTLINVQETAKEAQGKELRVKSHKVSSASPKPTQPPKEASVSDKAQKPMVMQTQEPAQPLVREEDSNIQLDWEDARNLTVLKDFTADERSALKEMQTPMERWLGIKDTFYPAITQRQIDELNYSEKSAIGKFAYNAKESLKNLGVGIVHSPFQTSKIPAQIALLGGMFANAVGAETTGEKWINWGNEKILNLDYFIKEFLPDRSENIGDSTLTDLFYSLGNVIGDVITTMGVSAAVKKSGNTLIMKAAEKAAAKNLAPLAKEGEDITKLVTAFANKSLHGSGKFGTKYMKFIKTQADLPMHLIMSKDVAGIVEERISQYRDPNAPFVIDHKTLKENTLREIGAIGAYGTLAWITEAKFGLGKLNKYLGLPGSETTIEALRRIDPTRGWLSKLMSNNVNRTFITLIACKEGMTEMLQEVEQIGAEYFFKLKTRNPETGNLEYQEKDFVTEAKRVLLSGVAGAVLGGGMSMGHAISQRDSYVNLIFPAIMEIRGVDEKTARKRAKEMYNNIYNKMSNAFTSEIQNKQSLEIGAGAQFARFTEFLNGSLNRPEWENNPELKAKDIQTEATALSGYLVRLLDALSLPVSDWETKLDIRKGVNKQGVPYFQFRWDGHPLTEELTQNDIRPFEEHKELTQQQEVSKEEMDDYNQYESKDYESLSQSLKNQAMEMGLKGDTVYVNKTTGEIASPELTTNFNRIAQVLEFKGELPSIDYNVPDINLKSYQSGAYIREGAFIFLNPSNTNKSTISHEFGHLYFDTLYNMYRNGLMNESPLKEGFETLLRELKVNPVRDVFLPTRKAEMLADIFSAHVQDGALIGNVTKKYKLEGRAFQKAVDTISEDFKKDAIKAWSAINHKGISITQGTKDFLTNVLKLTPESINTSIIDSSKIDSVKEDLKPFKDLSDEDKDIVARAVAQGTSKGLPKALQTVADEVICGRLAREGNVEEIGKFMRDKLDFTDANNYVGSVKAGINEYMVNKAKEMSSRKGLDPDKVIKDNVLYQQLLPNKEVLREIESKSSKASKGNDNAKMELSWLKALTSFRYGNMLGGLGTANVTLINDIFNVGYADIGNFITGKWKGVKDAIPLEVKQKAFKDAFSMYKKTLVGGPWSFNTQEIYDQAQERASLGKGKGIKGAIYTYGVYASAATTSGIDFFVKTRHAITQSSMMASKIAMEQGGNAVEIFEDSLKFTPETKQGMIVKEEAVKSMREVEFMSSLNENNTLGSKSINAFNKGLDVLFNTFGEEEGEFIRSLILPFNNIAAGQAARVINAMLLLPSSAYYGLKGTYNAIRDGDINALTSQMQNIKPYLKDGVFTLLVCGIFKALLDDDDIMPTYEQANAAQRKAMSALGIPENSIRIGGMWVSLDYLGPLKGAAYLLPSLNSIEKGEYNNLLYSYIGALATALTESPAVSLIKDTTFSVKEEDVSKAIKGYLRTFVPRIYTDTLKVVDAKQRKTDSLESILFYPAGEEKINPFTGKSDKDSPLLEFMFGRRAVEATEEQTKVLSLARRGINVIPSIKNTKLYKEASDKDKKEMERKVYSIYHKKLETLLRDGNVNTMDAEDLKKVIRNITQQAKKEANVGF